MKQRQRYAALVSYVGGEVIFRPDAVLIPVVLKHVNGMRGRSCTYSRNLEAVHPRISLLVNFYNQVRILRLKSFRTLLWQKKARVALI
jgi:hypothetical protein